jgi:hypothetical protein
MDRVDKDVARRLARLRLYYVALARATRKEPSHKTYHENAVHLIPGLSLMPEKNNVAKEKGGGTAKLKAKIVCGRTSDAVRYARRQRNNVREKTE